MPISEALISTGDNEWETPRWLFEGLDERLHFTLDPCSSHMNALCVKHFTKEEDGLMQSWAGETAFVNPPYSTKEQNAFVAKCISEAEGGAKIALLLPARTDAKRFHELLKAARPVFIAGRLRFSEAKESAPFPSVVWLFNCGEGLIAIKSRRKGGMDCCAITWRGVNP